MGSTCCQHTVTEHTKAVVCACHGSSPSQEKQEGTCHMAGFDYEAALCHRSTVALKQHSYSTNMSHFLHKDVHLPRILEHGSWAVLCYCDHRAAGQDGHNRWSTGLPQTRLSRAVHASAT
jgi:hypothetical protein